MIRSLLTLTTALGLSLSGLLPAVAQEAPAAAQPADAAPETAADTAAVAETPVDSGAFLAARNAETAGDFRAASAWFTQALSVDPDNRLLMDGSIFSLLSLGKIADAASVAEHRHALMQEGDQPAQLADLAQISQAGLNSDFAAIRSALDEGKSIGPLVDGLARAWADIGQGRMTEALGEFDEIAKRRGLEAHGIYHKALALALAGDFEGADKALSAPGLGLNRRGVLAHVQILSQLERNEDAIALIDKTWGTTPEPLAEVLRARLVAGETIPFDTVKDAREGMAEVFWSLATLLSGEAEPAFVQLNCRIAVALKPDHDDAILLGAAMLDQMGEYDLAEAAYDEFSPEHPSWYDAQLGRANALYSAGRKEAAIEVLKQLTRSHGKLLVVQVALGDMLRNEQRWAESEAAYSVAIGLLPDPPPRAAWLLYFSRGAMRERQNLHTGADLDFREALRINPGQPEVLNYLGYSLLERRQDLDEALAMIKQAVAGAPDSGMILDSLAWAYFMLGRYQEALQPIEQASLLEPLEAEITDHLGDIYWMNGRKREAEFQWHRALSYGPEAADAVRIRRKLEIGLDAVMAEEAARAPARPASPPGAPAPATAPAPGDGTAVAPDGNSEGDVEGSPPEDAPAEN